MKKVHFKQIRCIVRLNVKKRSKEFRKQKKCKKNTSSTSSWIESNSQISLMDDKSLSISFPEKFNLSENIDNSLDAINSIRKITSQSKNHLKRIDLNPIREISTSASLLLTAEIDKWNNKVGNRLTPRTKEWSPSVRKHLIDLGFFELCNFNYDEFKESENNNTLEIVKFIKGSNKDVNKAKFLRQEIERIVRGRVKRPSLFQALSEAITNVTHHAYPTKSQLEKNWYMTASFCDESRN